MGILALATDERVADVAVTDDELSVRLMDGRTIVIPLAWYPRLLNATAEQRKNWRISGGGYGIHWEDIDEDLSTEGFLRGGPAAPRPNLNLNLPIEKAQSRPIAVGNFSTVMPEEEGVKGLLDHAADVEEANQELSAALTWINDETVAVGEKLNRHTARIKQMSAGGRPVKPSEVKKIALLGASDINTFSNRIEGMLGDFERSVKRLEAGLSGIVTLADPASDVDAQQVATLRASLSDVLSQMGPVKEAMATFRDSALGLGALNISAGLTKAARRQASVIGGILRNIEETESFALRVNFQIEDKFGSLPGEDIKPHL